MVGETDQSQPSSNFYAADEWARLAVSASAETPREPLLYHKEHNLIPSGSARAAYAVQDNIVLLVEAVGKRRAFEFTLTCRDNCQSLVEFQRRWHSYFCNHLRKIFSAGVWVRERQARGAWHLHAVVVLPFEFQGEYPWGEVKNRYYRNIDPQLRKLWARLRRTGQAYGFGRVTLQPIRKTGSAVGRYIAKYLAKDIGRDPLDYGVRRWGCWGSAYRTRCSFAFVKSKTRKHVRYVANVLRLARYSDLQRVLGSKWGRCLLGWRRLGGKPLTPAKIRAVAALLKAGFEEQAEWLGKELMQFPRRTWDEVVTEHPFMEDLLCAWP